MTFRNCVIIIVIVGILYFSVMSELFHIQKAIEALDRNEKMELNERRWGLDCWSCLVKGKET